MRRLLIVLLLCSAALGQSVFIPPFSAGHQKVLKGTLVNYANPTTKDLTCLYPFLNMAKYGNGNDYRYDRHGKYTMFNQLSPTTGATVNGQSLYARSNGRIGIRYNTGFDGDARNANLITGYPFTWLMIAKHTTGANNCFWYQNRQNSNTNYASIGFLAGDTCYVQHYDGSDHAVAGVRSIADQEIVLMAYVCESATDRKLYVNGQLDNSSAVSANWTFTTATYNMFGNLDKVTGDIFYDGDWLYGAVWSRTLTESEIRGIYENPSGLFMTEFEMGTATQAAAAQMYMITKVTGVP